MIKMAAYPILHHFVMITQKGSPNARDVRKEVSVRHCFHFTLSVYDLVETRKFMGGIVYFVSTN